MKNKALELVDWLLRENTQLTVDSAYMIRNLVAELDKQEKSDTNLHLVSLADIDRSHLNSNETISQKPLTYEEIRDIWYQYEKVLAVVPMQFVRAIEERHGIK